MRESIIPFTLGVLCNLAQDGVVGVATELNYSGFICDFFESFSETESVEDSSAVCGDLEAGTKFGESWGGFIDCDFLVGGVIGLGLGGRGRGGGGGGGVETGDREGCSEAFVLDVSK